MNINQLGPPHPGEVSEVSNLFIFMKGKKGPKLQKNSTGIQGLGVYPNKSAKFVVSNHFTPP